jgi:hypothetical protein
MSEKGSIHIVKQSGAPSPDRYYTAAFVRGEDPAQSDGPVRELLSPQEVMQFLQQVLGQRAEEVRHYVDDLMANGRVRVDGVDEDKYLGFGRAA